MNTREFIFLFMDFRQFLVWGWKSKIQMENSTSCVYILTTQADDAPQNEA